MSLGECHPSRRLGVLRTKYKVSFVQFQCTWLEGKVFGLKSEDETSAYLCSHQYSYGPLRSSLKHKLGFLMSPFP